MEMKRWRWVGLVIVALLCWCGCRTAPTGPVLTPVQTLEAYIGALRNGDLDGVLRYSSENIRRSLNLEQPGRKAELARGLARDAEENRETTYQVSGDYSLGDRASVVLKVAWPGGSNTMEVPLVREDGEWRVDTVL